MGWFIICVVMISSIWLVCSGCLVRLMWCCMCVELVGVCVLVYWNLVLLLVWYVILCGLDWIGFLDNLFSCSWLIEWVWMFIFLVLFNEKRS